MNQNSNFKSTYTVVLRSRRLFQGAKCYVIMKWKNSGFVIVSLAALTLLVLVGILLELPLAAKTITGTFVIRPPDIKAKNPADKPTNIVVPTEDIFAKAEERQKTRKQQLKKYCLEHANENPLPRRQQLGQLLIDDDNKIIYCAVPKVGSTPMKRTLFSLRNDSDKFKGWSVHTPSLWKHMSEYNTSENSKRLATHFKFMFVREPFHRLLSGYKDKFFGKNRLYTNRFREMIVRAYRPQDVETVRTETNNVTFTEFLKFIVTSSNYLARDDHWRQCEHLCFPCTFNFHFIGHFETLAEDAAYMLKKAGIDDRVAFPPVRSSSAASDFMTYYSQVPHEIIFKVGEVFRSDFEMFGYPFPGPLKTLLANFTNGVL
ncbi:carbohydrate sulfotransferase 11-like isoform X1 [Oculina patagonica]